MLWNIHGYPRKSAGNRIKAAKQDTSSQPAPTICHCSAMMLHLAGFEAAQKRWQGSAPEAQLFAWICLVVPWRWHRRFGGWKPELGRRLSELVRACPSLSELVRACPCAMRGVCQATLGRAPPWPDMRIKCSDLCSVQFRAEIVYAQTSKAGWTIWVLLENVSDLWAQDAPFDLHDNR